MYQVPRQDLVREVMVPALTASTSVRCMVGYFDSRSFRALAPGLVAFISRPVGQMQLLASPVISESDQQAIRDAVANPQEIIERVAREIFAEARVSEEVLVRHHYDCLAYLLARGRLELRLVVMRTQGMFHPKVWLFADSEDTVALHGSSNATTSGLLYNFETVRLERPWRSIDALQSVAEFEDLFDRVWSRQDKDTIVVDLPEAVRLDLLRDGETRPAPTLDEFLAAWRAAHPSSDTGDAVSKQRAKPPRLVIPSYLEWERGPFAHQGAAVHAWEAAGRRGILAMATGAGKTIAALICATRVLETHAPLLVIISAPYRPLVQQWQDEVRAFGVEPLELTELSGDDRARRLSQGVRELRYGFADVHVAVVTTDFLVDHRFRRILDAIPASIRTMLIGDEVHNLGAAGFVKDPPQRFDLRLGLSATPERQYDSAGTAELFAFFGGDGPVYEFDLRQAIRAGCLVPYTYHLHPVELAEDEADEYVRFTDELRKAGFRGDEEDASDDRIRRLLVKRRAVIENAASKIAELRRLLVAADPRRLRLTLIYASDKNPAQLTIVNRLLREELDVLFHQLTAAETASKAKTEAILDRFAAGGIQVLTCKRVLDEGVNIPQVTTAYLLASSTVRRQWVQRRGRILRQCPSIGKSIARLHDFIVVPPDPTTPAGKSILRTERMRARAFAEAADNAGGEGDPFAVIDSLDEP
ncbi:MAG: DEAD/DEAH box helicase [Chloroflexi bacterium]|nr:DEAD/DEAH box helicase [Chloroflexota bacterium]